VPDPEPEPLTVIHAVGLNELQLQPAPVVTVTVPEPPGEVIDTLSGVTVYEHAAPACEIVSVCPPTVIVAVRAAPVFDATL
jgi:hypothetical protein